MHAEYREVCRDLHASTFFIEGKSIMKDSGGGCNLNCKRQKPINEGINVHDQKDQCMYQHTQAYASFTYISISASALHRPPTCLHI